MTKKKTNGAATPKPKKPKGERSVRAHRDIIVDRLTNAADIIGRASLGAAADQLRNGLLGLIEAAKQLPADYRMGRAGGFKIGQTVWHSKARPGSAFWGELVITGIEAEGLLVKSTNGVLACVPGKLLKTEAPKPPEQPDIFATPPAGSLEAVPVP